MDKMLSRIRKRLTIPRRIAVYPQGKVGMSGKENNEILALLHRAGSQGKLPGGLRYEYNSHPRLFGKDPFYIYPKGADIKRTAVKIRELVRQTYGAKYSVRLV